MVQTKVDFTNSTLSFDSRSGLIKFWNFGVYNIKLVFILLQINEKTLKISWIFKKWPLCSKTPSLQFELPYSTVLDYKQVGYFPCFSRSNSFQCENIIENDFLIKKNAAIKKIRAMKESQTNRKIQQLASKGVFFLRMKAD